MTKPNKSTIYTFLNSLAAALLIGLLLFLIGQRNIGIGFCFGAVLSVFSFASLRMFIPQLFRPGASVQSSVALTLILFFKLPIYGVLIYIAFRYCTAPLAILAGCCLVPCVITLETLAKMAVEKMPRRRKIVVPVLTPYESDAAETPAFPAADRNAEIVESHNRSSKTQPVREGVS